MSTTTLVVLTVAEIVALVVVLAIYLTLVINRLQSVSDNLAKVAFGVRALEVQISGVGPTLRKVNERTSELADDLLPQVARKAEEVAGR